MSLQVAEHMIPEYSILWDLDPADKSVALAGASKRKQPTNSLETPSRKRILTEKKVIQNRIAQKAFRERKEAQFKELEAKALYLEQLLAARSTTTTAALKKSTTLHAIQPPATGSNPIPCASCNYTHSAYNSTPHPLLVRFKTLQDQIEELELENVLLKAEPAAPVSNERLRHEVQFLAEHGLLDHVTLRKVSGSLNDGFGIGYHDANHHLGSVIAGLGPTHMRQDNSIPMGIHGLIPTTNHMHSMVAAMCGNQEHSFSHSHFGLPSGV
ncbi:hypothetical protein BJ741DRAFT_662603 [Chytriomyces cf. hyalinus JEL632]|nr:hypothetical protein BJ741DRAFT_662603 [Chytriomyces cf. hyalinus JEL632]